MNKTRLFFHNLENVLKGVLVKILFKKSINISPAEIDIIARPQLSEKDIFINSPLIKEVIVFSKKEFFFPLKILSFINILKRNKYDIAIIAGSTSVSFTSLLLAFLSRAKIRAGYDGEYFGKKRYTDAFLTTPVPYDPLAIKHQVIRNLDILSYLNIPIVNIEHYMHISAKEKISAGERLEQRGIIKSENTIIGIHLGANVLLNRWPVEKFAEISDYFTDIPKTKVIIFHGPKEKDLAGIFRKIAKNEVFIQNALPLRQFASMISLLDVFVCNDTGVLHVAAAVGTKTVAIFGPTDPKQWNPLGKKHLWVRHEDGSVLSIKPEEIIEKIKELLP